MNTAVSSKVDAAAVRPHGPCCPAVAAGKPEVQSNLKIAIANVALRTAMVWRRHFHDTFVGARAFVSSRPHLPRVLIFGR